MMPRPRRPSLLPSRRAGVCVAASLLLVFSPNTGLGQGEEENVTHRARAGDTVPRLSWFYRVRADAIRAANPQLRSDELTPGQIVVIPLAGTAATAPSPSPAAAASRIKIAAATQPSAPPATTVSSTTTPLPIPSPPPRALPIDSTPASAPRAATVVAFAPPLPPAASPPPADLPSTRSPAAVDPGHLPPVPASVAPAPTTVIIPRRGSDEADNADPARQSGRSRIDFLSAARRLAAQRISYNGTWTPPGQRSAWTMDCSNTARWLYHEAAGIELPRTASDQYETLRAAGRLWEAPRDDAHRPEKLDRFLATRLQPGDLLFWENTYQPVRRPDITHVMIFLGRDASGRLLMAGSQRTDGVSIYRFDPHATKGGYSAWFGLVRRHGRFVAYGRPEK